MCVCSVTLVSWSLVSQKILIICTLNSHHFAVNKPGELSRKRKLNFSVLRNHSENSKFKNKTAATGKNKKTKQKKTIRTS